MKVAFCTGAPMLNGMSRISRALLLVLTLLTSACAMVAGGPVGNKAVPEPAKPVDLSLYLGRWYEIARYEASFQRGCETVTADYSLRPDGMIRVLNACRQDRVDGPVKQAEGKAYVVEGSQNAKLRVSFFGPFYGNYWVLDHADDYSWSIVGEPSGRYLWLLARQPHPPAHVVSDLKARTASLGYDLSWLRMTQHP